MQRQIHRETYVPTETEHQKIEQAIINYPRRNKPETNLRDHTIFSIASLTGLRINEVLKIKIKDFNWERRTITIQAENSKNRRENFVWICNPLLIILQKYITHFKPNDYLFFSLSNNPLNRGKMLGMTGWTNNWKSYLKKSGLEEVSYTDLAGQKRQKIRFHTATRTYFINRLFKNNPGLNLADLSRVSRHRSIQCLYDYYLRFNDLELWQNIKY